LVPCHHGMPCPPAAIGEHGRQIWSVVTNMGTLNEPQSTADRE
jgi:hypothetical protein